MKNACLMSLSRIVMLPETFDDRMHAVRHRYSTHYNGTHCIIIFTISAGHPEEQPGHKIYRPNGQTRPESCRMCMRTGVRPHVKVACPISSYQIRQSIVDFPASYGCISNGMDRHTGHKAIRTAFIVERSLRRIHFFGVLQLAWTFCKAEQSCTVRYSTSRVHLL